MPYQPILGTLAYILSKDRTKTLLVHRNKRKQDHHIGKFNGLGGKMEPSEDIVSCVKREVYEEAGIVCTDIHLRGSINWTGFGLNGENWLGFIFRIDAFEGVPYTSNEEGDLCWVRLDKLETLPMWEGDRYFLPLVFDDDPRSFHGFMPYKNGKPTDWQYVRI